MTTSPAVPQHCHNPREGTDLGAKGIETSTKGLFPSGYALDSAVTEGKVMARPSRIKHASMLLPRSMKSELVVISLPLWPIASSL